MYDPGLPPEIGYIERFPMAMTTANNGVKTLVRTGAMFSITLCLASTSHATTTTAPTAPQGSTHAAMNGEGAIISILWLKRS